MTISLPTTVTNDNFQTTAAGRVTTGLIASENNTDGLTLATGGGKKWLVGRANAEVELYHNNNLKFETTGIGVSATGTVEGFDELRAPHSGTAKTITVTVASKTAAHRYQASGSGSGYVLDGVQAPFLTLTPGRTYKFDTSDSSNSGHPFRFYLEADKTTAYTTGVTVNGTAGSSGSYTQIEVSDTTPVVLHYQCSSHGYMGNAVNTNSSTATNVTANSVALGADTTGNYVATVAGTANEVEVSGSGSETAAVTIGLPNSVTITTNLTTPHMP